MQLTGTTIQERIASAIAFAKAHRSHEYDCDKTAGIYRMAGVPFTEAAEKFWREWYGVWDCIDFYPDRPNVVNSDGEHHIERIDFYFSLVEDAEKLEVGYTPESYLGWPDSAGIIRKKYGDDTVPVSEGGYYYPSDIWVCSAGRIISVLPEDFEEIGDEHVWNTLDEFLCFVLEGEHPARIEKVLARKELEGSLDENVSTTIAFAKAHGGFKHCRLTSAAARCVTMMTVLSVSARRFSRSFFSVVSSSALVASSSTRTGEPENMARAIAILCIWPSDRPVPRSPNTVSIPLSSSLINESAHAIFSASLMRASSVSEDLSAKLTISRTVPLMSLLPCGT